jgi:hypothetical protein
LDILRRKTMEKAIELQKKLGKTNERRRKKSEPNE